MNSNWKTVIDLVSKWKQDNHDESWRKYIDQIVLGLLVLAYKYPNSPPNLVIPFDEDKLIVETCNKILNTNLQVTDEYICEIIFETDPYMEITTYHNKKVIECKKIDFPPSINHDYMWEYTKCES